VETGRVTTQHLDGDLWLVTAEGEHDLAVSPGIGDTLDDLERRVGTKIIVDLTPADFIDSTVIAALARHSDRHDRVVVVVPPDSFARRLFDLVHLEDQLELAESVDDALARIDTPRDDSADRTNLAASP
jgi:anti-anti-sigma factor